MLCLLKKAKPANCFVIKSCIQQPLVGSTNLKNVTTLRVVFLPRQTSQYHHQHQQQPSNSDRRHRGFLRKNNKHQNCHKVTASSDYNAWWTKGAGITIPWRLAYPWATEIWWMVSQESFHRCLLTWQNLSIFYSFTLCLLMLGEQQTTLYFTENDWHEWELDQFDPFFCIGVAPLKLSRHGATSWWGATPMQEKWIRPHLSENRAHA